MIFSLNNECLALQIQKPGDPYKGARFDWTGQIIQITYLNRHTFCTTESLSKKMINNQGRGLYNEFGIDQALGYEKCPVGENFTKIGVGLLRKKNNKPYDFFSNYEIMPSFFRHSIDKTKMQFYCEEQRNNNGYAYILEKRIELNKNTFSINYLLSNCGEKTFSTNEYVHNFLSINGRKMDKNYKLFFPFHIEQKKLGQFVNPNNIIQILGDTISWNSVPKDQFFVSNLNTDFHKKGSWTLIHLKDKVGIKEKVDFNIDKVNLWGSSHVVSPEIYVNLKVAPGEKISWSRNYETFSLD